MVVYKELKPHIRNKKEIFEIFKQYLYIYFEYSHKYLSLLYILCIIEGL